MSSSGISAASVAASTAALLVSVTACAWQKEQSQQGPSSQQQQLETDAVTAEQMMDQLDEQTAEAVRRSMLADEFSGEESDYQVRRRVAEVYLQAYEETGDPVLAQARLSSLFSDGLFADRVQSWSQSDADSAGEDFFALHRPDDAAELEISVTDDGAVVEWSPAAGADDPGCVDSGEHWVAMSITVDTDAEGDPMITEFDHQSGCDCHECLQAV